jgi:hypothetical protein
MSDGGGQDLGLREEDESQHVAMQIWFAWRCLCLKCMRGDNEPDDQ